MLKVFVSNAITRKNILDTKKLNTLVLNVKKLQKQEILEKLLVFAVLAIRKRDGAKRGKIKKKLFVRRAEIKAVMPSRCVRSVMNTKKMKKINVQEKTQ